MTRPMWIAAFIACLFLGTWLASNLALIIRCVAVAFYGGAFLIWWSGKLNREGQE